MNALSVATLAFSLGVAALPASTIQGVTSLASRDDAAYPNAINHSFRRYVAIGDSYSAGPGPGRAGNPITTPPGPSPPYTSNCWQDDGAWPVQLNASLDVGEFQFSACTGYNTKQIRDIEITDPNSNFGDPDLVTLTLGGNDNNLFANTVVSCAYTNNNCSGALQNSVDTVAGLGPELNETISLAATWNRAPDNRRLVIVSGYPLLYNDVNDAALFCKTAKSVRQQINADTVNLNNKIRELTLALQAQFAQDPNGPTVYYADPEAPDQYAQTPAPDGRTFPGHRFCEEKPFDSYFNGGSLPNPFGGSFPTSLDAYKSGLFHPLTAGHTIIKDGVQNVISLALQGKTQSGEAKSSDTNAPVS